VSGRAPARAGTGTIVLLTRLARAVFLRSSVDLVGMNLRNMVTLAESAQGSIEDEILGGLSAPERAELRRLLVKALEEHQPGGGR